MKNKNYDVDTLLQKAMSSSEKPDAELIKKVKYELVKEEVISQESIFKRFFGRAVAIIAAMLVITTAALAAGGYLGGFDRLRGIIGEDRAALVQPLEISNVVGEVITESGIRVEVVAVGVFDNVVDIYLTLEDLIGNRLDGEISIFYELSPMCSEGTDIGGLGFFGGVEIIDRTNGVVTIYNRHVFTQSVAGQDLTFTLRNINYNIRYYLDHEINLDLVTAMPNIPSVQLILDYDDLEWLCENNFYQIRGPIILSYYDTKLLTTTGITILEPNLHDIELGLESIEKRISSIGIIDGRLHIQLYEPSPGNIHSFAWSSWLRTVTPEEEKLESWRQVQYRIDFSIDEFGNFYRGEYIHPHYREYILEVDLDRLSEYRLLGDFWAAGFIDLKWTVTFQVENHEMQLVIDDLNIDNDGRSTIKEVRLNPFALLIKAEVNLAGDPPLGTPDIKINTDSGVITPTLSMFSRRLWEYGNNAPATWVYNINEGFLYLDSVISIEIAGETIYLR